MDALIFQDISAEEREVHIQANCKDSEVKDVKVYFTEEELIEKRALFSENSIKLKREEERFKILKTEHEAIVKPLVEDNVYILGNIRAGFVEVSQQVYIMPDYEERMVGYYNSKGELLESRRMLPHERQMNIKTNN